MTQYTCDKCEKTFGSEDALEQHKQDYDHSKLTACPDCGDTFTSDAVYRDHRTTHRNTAHEFLAKATKTHLVVGGVLALLLVGGFFGFSGPSGSPTGNTAASGETGTQVGMTASDATFTTVDGETKQLSDYQGQKVMFWVFATWCPSCKQAARALQANNDELQDVTIIALKTRGNAGYNGPSIQQFAQQYAPQMVNADNWVWGDLSATSTRKWNPQNRPDIYWLIDEDGTIKAKTGAPAATMNRITQFVQSQGSQELMGESVPIEGRTHYSEGTALQYNPNPPTSGPHWPSPADWGFYDESLPDERVVHNLEHGGIWISYREGDLDQATVDTLRAFASRNPNAVIVTPRPENDAPIAVASWGRLMELEVYDEQTITEFLHANLNNAPEPLASASHHQ